MHILLDQGTPVALRSALLKHVVVTAYEKGWSALTNGELLRLAAAEFEVFITTDQNLYYQQNLIGSQMAILILPFANWPKLQQHLAAIVAAVDGLKAGDYLELKLN